MNMTDYAATYRDYQLKVPREFNYVTDVVDRWASRTPTRRALLAVDAAGEVVADRSFAELSEASRRAANVLNGAGIGKGDRILVILPRIPEWYEVMLGAFRIGAVPMPGTTQLTARDIDYRIERSGAVAVVTDELNRATVDACPSSEQLVARFVVEPEPAPTGWRSWPADVSSASDRAPDGDGRTLASDPLLVYFTSGTTAHPKMVEHTHASYGIGHDATARFWQDLTPDDLHWTVSDLGWAKAAWGKLFGQWRIGAAVFLHDARGKPDHERMLSLLVRHGVTTFCAPPTIYRQLVGTGLPLSSASSLRHAMAAGEALDPETFGRWHEATGTEIHDGYGQTETCNIVANFRCMPKRPGSMGLPVPGYDVDVVDDEGGRITEPGQVGSIAVRTDPDRPVGLFTRYVDEPDLTASVFRDGWYLTGDRGSRDDEGYFYFSARADDVIISAGYRIGPFEVESVLIEHPAVREVAVVGVPDAERGEVVKAFAVLNGGRQRSDELKTELQNHVKQSTAPYKYPRYVEFLDELPKTVSGKIRRVELRNRPRG